MSRPIAVVACDTKVRSTPSNYPEPYASRMAGRQKRPLADMFGLCNFGVNLTSLAPGAVSALHHRHSTQDEFVFVLSGELTLITSNVVTILRPGMCAGFSANGESHHLENRSQSSAVYLEIGDRKEGDHVEYPLDDLVAIQSNGRWVFRHKDGSDW